MYERAVLRKPVGKTFGATVDLWSIGIQLLIFYQILYVQAIFKRLKLQLNNTKNTFAFIRCHALSRCNWKFAISTIWWKEKQRNYVLHHSEKSFWSNIRCSELGGATYIVFITIFVNYF